MFTKHIAGVIGLAKSNTMNTLVRVVKRIHLYPNMGEFSCFTPFFSFVLQTLVRIVLNRLYSLVLYSLTSKGG